MSASALCCGLMINGPELACGAFHPQRVKQFKLLINLISDIQTERCRVLSFEKNLKMNKHWNLELGGPLG